MINFDKKKRFFEYVDKITLYSLDFMRSSEIFITGNPIFQTITEKR